MPLERELGLIKPITLQPHKALLNIYYTASRLRRRAGEFLRRFGLTDVQFNLMMLLHHQSGTKGGLSQARLSDMMLVNRANITSLIDRMEKSDLVVRTTTPEDRRYNVVKLTAHGKKLLAQVELLYAREVKRIMAALEEAEQKRLITMLEKIRGSIEE
ncbi:MAG: MarR family transcriptional regulator [Sedimentisphaerales bacterium]